MKPELCRAQQMSLTRSRTSTFQRRLRSLTLRQRLTQPTLGELLVRHVLLLPQIERNLNAWCELTADG
jgi:hypothetical protein